MPQETKHLTHNNFFVDNLYKLHNCMFFKLFQYYNAEVTGLSKKTCVVRFLEYGNFEEVLQDDCIPATEVRITCSTVF